MKQTSRHWIVDGIEVIANCIAICSHLQENLNSYGTNESISSTDATLCKVKIDSYTNIRREIMDRIKDDFEGNKNYWCALKHAIGIWMYTTEIAYANKDDGNLWGIQQQASDNMYEILSIFINQEITTCGRCLNDTL